VTNVGHNQSIAPNETVQFGFNAKKNQLNIPAELPVLGGICSSVNSNQAPVAIASVTPATGTIPFDVTFNASASTDPDNDTLTYIWDFGNGDTAITAIATRSFTTAGNYTATLTVSDGVLDSPTKTFTVTANDTPPTDDIAYSLDPMASTVYFVSTKKTHVIESHTFTNISGNVSDLGSAKLVIDLNSVDTNNLTRDERMKNMLFETAVFSEATVTVALDPTTYANQSIGTTQTQSLNATVDLHGVSTLLSVEVLVSKLTDSTLLVQNVAPVLLNTTDYNLNAGVEALRAVANLSVISYAVPVNFNLVFNKTANLP
jgi:PKD repeat protein